MNYSYLMKHCAQRTYSAARRYDKRPKCCESVIQSEDMDDEPYVAALLRDQEFREYKGRVPHLFIINDALVYAQVPYPGGFFLLGPTRFNTHYDMRYTLNDSSLPSNSKLMSLLPEYRAFLFIEDILLLSNSFRSGKEDEPFYDEHRILIENWKYDETGDSMSQLYQKIFDNVEKGFVHNPYRHEKRQVDAIERGDVSSLNDILKERFPGRYGSLSEDPVRQEIYIGIVETTLASRAAIKGGLHPETAFYLSDITIQKLDKCHDTITAMNISLDMQRKYAQLVKELKADRKTSETQSSNINISHCKDYIFSHLHDKITVGEIANAIGLDENYLSSLFRNVEGISLKDYIQNEKVTLAKHMLTYSQYSFSEISTYLGFSSQSHFGKVFKKYTGYTPKSYRDNFAAEDFMNDTTESIY